MYLQTEDEKSNTQRFNADGRPNAPGCRVSPMPFMAFVTLASPFMAWRPSSDDAVPYSHNAAETARAPRATPSALTLNVMTPRDKSRG
jgi:hypothetical protein